jgi:CheY-like chemotaxis protein
MVKPLALIVYENLLLGSQLVNRLRDLGYNVETLDQPEKLIERAAELKPLLILADLDCRSAIEPLIQVLRQNGPTSHIPVLGYTSKPTSVENAPSFASGANLVASDQAIVAQLPQLLDQVLQID